jgi:transcriptional regulator with XRE-family HTH domain
VRKPSSKLRKILADNMRAFRVEHGLSQEALADACGLHRTYIGSVERCERNVTLSTLELLSGALDVSVPELLSKN